MRVATYNLRFGGLGGLRTHLAALAEVHDPDLILLQECLSPKEYERSSELGQTVIWRPAEPMTWGSAIVTRLRLVRELIVPGFDGWVVGAELEDVATTFQAFSVHVPSGRGSYTKVLHQILDAIVAGGYRPSLIGGDFNIGVGLRRDGELLQTTAAERKVTGTPGLGVSALLSLAEPQPHPFAEWCSDPTHRRAMGSHRKTIRKLR